MGMIYLPQVKVDEVDILNLAGGMPVGEHTIMVDMHPKAPEIPVETAESLYAEYVDVPQPNWIAYEQGIERLAAAGKLDIPAIDTPKERISTSPGPINWKTICLYVGYLAMVLWIIAVIFVSVTT